MSPIKDFRMFYEILNKEHTFSEGDTVAGTVTFTLTKDTKVKSLHVKIKGDANVRWTETYGNREQILSAHRRYFKRKAYLVVENTNETTLPHGVHRFKFRITIPQKVMPRSFRGVHGRIVYMLEAKLRRSWNLPAVIKQELNFMPKSLSQLKKVTRPRTSSVDKEVGVFSKGQVQMSATVDRKVCSPGDTLSIVAKVYNSSPKKVTAKFSLQRKLEYAASGSVKRSDESLCKMVGDNMKANSEETVHCKLKIPGDAFLTLHNCDIILVEYYLKVYLDIRFAFDLVVLFPLVIVPSRPATRPSQPATRQPGKAHPAGATGGPSNSDFPPPAFPTGPDPVLPGPSADGYPDKGATASASGYSNQPEKAAEAFHPSLEQHQGPPAPPLLQEEAPPSYTSLFPSSDDSDGSTGSDKKNKTLSFKKEHRRSWVIYISATVFIMVPNEGEIKNQNKKSK